jgi:hypothetical protein
MSKFQVVNLKPMSGVSKGSGRPYNMLICSGIFTNADGTMEVGEVVFMEGTNRPLPMHLQPGQSYVPSVSARSRDGKLTFEISDLKPMTAAGGKPLSAAA